MNMNVDWIQTLTIIGSIIIPMMAGFGWLIHRMDAKFDKMGERLDKIDDRMNSMENRLTAVEMRVSFIERILEIFRGGNSLTHKERTDP